MTKKMLILILLFGICLPVYAQTLTVTSLQKEVLEKYKDLTQEEWLEKIKYGGLEHKFDNQLKELEDSYPEKITRVSALSYVSAPDLTPEENEKQRLEFEQHKAEKIERLKDKFAAVIKEIEFREKKIVERTPHGTTYYIDYVNGLDTNDGLGTGTAWKTIDKYTSDTRTVGDIAYVRANQTHTYNAADITFLSDGTATSRIELVGCNATQGIDPWGDSSDVKPIISFGDANYQAYLYTDNYWYFKNLEWIESADSWGNFQCGVSEGAIFENCVFRDASNATAAKGLIIYTSGSILLKNCDFYNNVHRSLQVEQAFTRVENCDFDGGGATTDYGLYVYSAIAELRDCNFGVTTTHDTADIYFYRCGQVYGRNIKLSSPTEVTRLGAPASGTSTFVKIEDYEGTKGANKSWYFAGEVEKDTSVTRTGGASSSAKMSPNSDCSDRHPLTLAEEDWCSGDFKIWCSAAATTITIYIRGFGWSTFPTASELYIEASYLSNASTPARSTVVSNDVLTDNTTWTAFDVTFTPLQAGWAYVTVYLKKYTANCGVYVDIKPE